MRCINETGRGRQMRRGMLRCGMMYEASQTYDTSHHALVRGMSDLNRSWMDMRFRCLIKTSIPLLPPVKPEKKYLWKCIYVIPKERKNPPRGKGRAGENRCGGWRIHIPSWFEHSSSQAKTWSAQIFDKRTLLCSADMRWAFKSPGKKSNSKQASRAEA